MIANIDPNKPTTAEMDAAKQAQLATVISQAKAQLSASIAREISISPPVTARLDLADDDEIDALANKVAKFALAVASVVIDGNAPKKEWLN